MKKITLLISLLAATGMTIYAGGDHHDHAGHGHAHEHEAPKVKEHNHGTHDGHDHGVHAEKRAGPNGGRIISAVEPHFEFLVTPDRKVQITFLNNDGKVIVPDKQTIALIGGSRSDPTKLTFEREDDVLLSTQSLPESQTVPVILTIKVSPESKAVRERFNVNLSECPTCDYLEYACICDH